MRRFFAILLKILLGLGLLVVLAVVGALIALRVPSVQTRIGHEVADVLTRKLGQQVTIGGVDIRPFSRVRVVQHRAGRRQYFAVFGV